LFERPERGERAILVRIGLGQAPDADELAEFDALARSAGAIPVATITGSRRSPEPRYFIGSGKAGEVRDRAQADSAELVLVDHELSPSQERNLEKLTGRRVLDRTGLILDIFATRARSAEGKLEVELAQLRHLSTRLVRGWTHLERQKGGIGLRGPGETQLETDRRLIGKRIRTLTAKLEKLARRRDTGRQVRKRVPVPGVALIGYTNAGKSTLFRALTGADAYVADQLFATLDPTVRRLRLPHTPDIVVADTVGFVRDLPHELVAAFRSTLMEAREADLLLHVVDCADPEREQRIAQVQELVEGIGAGAIPQLRVFNKIDRLGRPPELLRDAAGRPSAVWLSAASGAGVGGLRDALQEIFGQAAMRLAVLLPPQQGRLRARLYDLKLVRAEETLPDGNVRLLVEASLPLLESLCRDAGVDFATAVSPCLPAPGFVEFPRDAATSAA
jgi:GTP-binding protein HflX